MANTITLDVDDKQVLSALRELKAKAGSLEPANNSIGNMLKNRVVMGFRLGQAPQGKKWEPLKTRRGQPLRDTGRLQRSITYSADGRGLEVGTNVEYATVHQYGKTGPKPAFNRLITQAFGKKLKSPVWQLVQNATWNLPARPFLPTSALPESWGSSVLDILQDHLDL